MSSGGQGTSFGAGPAGTGGYQPAPTRPTYQQTPGVISDPYRNFGMQPPRYMDGGGMLPQAISDPYREFGNPTMQPLTPTGGLTPAGQFGGQPGAVGANGQSFGAIDPRTGRPSGMPTLQGNAFNPAANQWGDYQQREGDGLWGTDAQGINRVNGHVFAPSGLTSGNTDFANWMNRFAPQFAQQNGPINQGRAYVGPQGPQTMMGAGQMPGSMGATNGLGRGGMPPGFDPSRGMPYGAPSNGPGMPPNPLTRSAPSMPNQMPQGIDPRTGRPYGLKTF